MLKTLDYSVTFSTTGRTLAETVLFQEGFGAITGPNEAGKSLIIEMIRFSLFGTAALRGTTSDYKTLKVSLTFVVKDTEYLVERTISTAKISVEGKEIAVGVKPVNNKVVQILGFGLAVFDISCVANQGDLEALGDMRPSDRKRMVDSVIGLGVVEDLAKFAGEEAIALRRRAEDLTDTLVEPTAPTKPDDYTPAADLKLEIDSLQNLRTELDQITGWLTHEKPKPVQPPTTSNMSASDLRPLAEQQKDLHAKRLTLTKLIDMIPVSDTVDIEAAEAALAAWEAFQAREVFLRNNPIPTHTSKELARLRKALEDWDNWCLFEHLRMKRQELLETGYHTCPACSHEFPVAGDEVAAVDEQLAKIKPPKREPVQPSMTWDDLERAERMLAHWTKVQDQFVDAPEAPEPDLDRAGIERARAAAAQVEQRTKAIAERDAVEAELRDQPDYQKLLNTAIQEEAAITRWLEDLDRYNHWLAERDKKLARADDLTRITASLPILFALYTQAHTWEIQQAQYEKALAAFEQAKGKANELQEQSEGWASAKEALVRLRLLVKQHLVPSLNRVASHLLKQMTGGQRQIILVDEEFNITVDGQPLNTLSGSGKAVANLALRLGLGQVLTNGVLSLFMGDEIDASMDKDRAENTSNTLQTLKQRISQILLVTHKYPSADYYITLGNLNDQLSSAS